MRKLPHHTSSVLVDGARQIEIEPTCADWFETGEPSRRRSEDRETGTDPASIELGEERAQIASDVALVAMVYYNRGVEALKGRRFEEAIRLNRLALVLDADNETAVGNLLAATNKQALELWRCRGLQRGYCAVTYWSANGSRPPRAAR